jgi:hypothetical protein
MPTGAQNRSTVDGLGVASPMQAPRGVWIREEGALDELNRSEVTREVIPMSDLL